eukprot:767720-Hanusia_phi.AAC.1
MMIRRQVPTEPRLAGPGRGQASGPGTATDSESGLRPGGSRRPRPRTAPGAAGLGTPNRLFEEFKFSSEPDLVMEESIERSFEGGM